MTYFWRAKCKVTGRELKFCSSNLVITGFEQMREWVNAHFRNLDLLEYAPWDAPTHRGVFYKVPVQHVKFEAPVPELSRPEPRRVSLLVRRIHRKKLLTP